MLTGISLRPLHEKELNKQGLLHLSHRTLLRKVILCQYKGVFLALLTPQMKKRTGIFQNAVILLYGWLLLQNVRQSQSEKTSHTVGRSQCFSPGDCSAMNLSLELL